MMGEAFLASARHHGSKVAFVDATHCVLCYSVEFHLRILHAFDLCLQQFYTKQHELKYFHNLWDNDVHGFFLPCH